MTETSSCYRCDYVMEGVAEQCPKCGGRLLAASRVRALGWVLLPLGIFLVGLMGAVTYYTAPLMLRAGEEVDGSRFTGTPGQATMILALFGLVIAFGLGCIANAVWQIKTGRRNKGMLVVMMTLAGALMLFAFFLQSMFGE